MRYRLMNSAMMPAPGMYRMLRVRADAFIGLVRDAAREGRLVSYCGYPQNAEWLTRESGVPIEVSRRHAGPDMRDGDVLLIMTLTYRVDGRKGVPVREEDFEFAIAEFTS